MAEATERDRRAVRQGLSLLAAVALLAAAVFFLDPIQRWLDEGPELVVTASRSRGLTPGAEVWVAGTRGGRVKSVDFRPPDSEATRRVIVRAVLNEDAAEHVRAGAEAWIQPAALLAPTVLMITAGPRGNPPYDFGDTLHVQHRITAQELMASADTVRTWLDSLRTAGQEVARALERGQGTLGRLHRDEGLRRSLRRDVRAVRELASAVRNHRGVDAVARAHRAGLLDSVMARSRRAADTLARRDDALRTLERSLAALEGRAGRIEDMLEAGRGTAGRLVADGELQDQLRLLLEDVARVREALTADPLRWLRIRLF